MKSIVIGIAFIILFMVGATWVDPAAANQPWVRCKHIPTGEVQMFPGMQCPMGWHPV